MGGNRGDNVRGVTGERGWESRGQRERDRGVGIEGADACGTEEDVRVTGEEGMRFDPEKVSRWIVGE
jgi:hypothetical protein